LQFYYNIVYTSSNKKCQDKALLFTLLPEDGSEKEYACENVDNNNDEKIHNADIVKH